jgi:hypothetical protein
MHAEDQLGPALDHLLHHKALRPLAGFHRNSVTHRQQPFACRLSSHIGRNAADLGLV